MAIRRTLSFTDARIVEWINRNGGSRYIAKLVLDDMEGNFVSKDEVIKLIEDRLGKRTISKINIDKNNIMGLIDF